jgi:hypothetical protein
VAATNVVIRKPQLNHMWRVEVAEVGRSPLPPIDIDGEELVIGSGEGCRVRLPAAAVRPHHLRLRWMDERPVRVAWFAGHDLEIEEIQRGAGSNGKVNVPLRVTLGGYRVRISAAPASAVLSSPQRTESLAREMIRNIMGGAAPRLVVEVGPAVGSSCTLAPPDSRMTVGRGDEADWIILDEDLSRVHAALIRTWDGVSIVDLGSKNGTVVDGESVPPGEQGRLLRDGARIALGDVVVRYRDDAEGYLQAEPSALAPEPGLAAATPTEVGSALVSNAALVWVGLGIAIAAVAAAVWLMSAG